MSDLRHRLYERAVQSPEHDLTFLERVYERHVGGWARTLREDFCGTALLAARWVESDDEREAVGIDLDPDVLAHARHDLDQEEAARLTLLEADVRTRTERAYDVLVAMNFSWAVLEDDALAAYFESARACCEGAFVLELFGGPQLRVPRRAEHRVDEFTYAWEQRGFDGRYLDARLHFALDDGRRLDDAFRYRFVLRDVAEVRARLAAAGFEGHALYVEDSRGRRSMRAAEPKAPLWRGYLVAW